MEPDKDNIRQEPYTLPQGFTWDALDLGDRGVVSSPGQATGVDWALSQRAPQSCRHSFYPSLLPGLPYELSHRSEQTPHIYCLWAQDHRNSTWLLWQVESLPL